MSTMRGIPAIGAAAVIAGAMIALAFPTGALDSRQGDSTSMPTQMGDVETHVVEGRIRCAVGGAVVVISTTDLCPPGALTGSSGAIWVPIQPGRDVTGAHYELAWTPSLPTLSGRLALVFPHLGAEDYQTTSSGKLHMGFVARGGSPLWVRLEAVETSDPLSRSTMDELPFEVRPSFATHDDVLAGEPEYAAGLVVDQPYRLCVTWAYEGAALPLAPDCGA